MPFSVRPFALAWQTLLLVLCLVAQDAARAQPPVAVRSADALARDAVAEDPARAEAAIVALRALGPRGHARLLAVHAEAIARLIEEPPLAPDAATERLRHAIDRVSGQRDGHASGLFFFDDLHAAQAEARRRNVPILSLRLLGRLDEELSCANSRYFRTLLYPDEALADRLRDHVVLHVSTERPAPRITIDMGDGRTMTRTITGNSVHYLLDHEGRVLDALPGLYSPSQFLIALDAAIQLFDACDLPTHAAVRECVADAHARATTELEGRWERLRATNPSLPDFEALATETPRPTADGAQVSAVLAMPLTITKMRVETPLLEAIARDPVAPSRSVDFRALAASFLRPLGPRTAALIRLKTGRLDVAPFVDALGMESTADGLRNEFVMHRVVHGWLADRSVPIDLATFNARVYRELFLTPANDPWLGLRSPGVWDAIEELR